MRDSLPRIDDKVFRAVADFTYDWESWHAPDGRLVWVNTAVERITGYAVEECLAMPGYPEDMIAPEDRGRVADVLRAARDATTGEDVEFRCVHRSGSVRWMSLAWQPMYGESDEFLGFRTSVRDVTERHSLREQLRLYAEHLEHLVQERTHQLRALEQRQRQMEKLAALGQLAAGVAHEINNPLAGMRNAFELFKTDVPREHEHFELLELIDREIERISLITHQMYQLYRRTPPQTSDFSLTRAIDEVVYLSENSARQRGVILETRFPDGGIDVKLAEGEVKQVLFNLIRNAIQASPEGGRVRIATHSDDREVGVRIADEGPGVDEADLSRIFDPFFTTRQGEADAGMGLGLSVSRSLVEAMGGRIDVVNTPSGGAVFTAVFPMTLESTSSRDDE
ncbi:MAG: PAS domain S-box protein [Planctomyces sp.]|nr:PAS domain S-box protein [Planctomyces sp.]